MASRRDTTRALALAREIRSAVAYVLDDTSTAIGQCDALIAILTAMDARTGRRDPRVRKTGKKTKAAKRGAR
jgi:hypothetical protein